MIPVTICRVYLCLKNLLLLLWNKVKITIMLENPIQINYRYINLNPHLISNWYGAVDCCRLSSGTVLLPFLFRYSSCNPLMIFKKKNRKIRIGKGSIIFFNFSHFARILFPLLKLKCCIFTFIWKFKINDHKKVSTVDNFLMTDK